MAGPPSTAEPIVSKRNGARSPTSCTGGYLILRGAQRPELNPDNPKYKAAIALWKRLPVPVANLVGPHLCEVSAMTPQRTILTAAPLPFGNLLRSVGSFWGGKKHRARLVSELKAHYAVRAVFLVSSGKAALTVILKALSVASKRRRVIIPAYTCFSVPSAIVKAGLEVMPCDVDPNTLDFKWPSLRECSRRRPLCRVNPSVWPSQADIGCETIVRGGR